MKFLKENIYIIIFTICSIIGIGYHSTGIVLGLKNNTINIWDWVLCCFYLSFGIYGIIILFERLVQRK